MAVSSLALTWADHRRTQELCAGLGLELVVLKNRSRGLRRYVDLARRTGALLAARPVDVLLVTNPSLILATLCVALRRVHSYRLIVADMYVRRPYRGSSMTVTASTWNR